MTDISSFNRVYKTNMTDVFDLPVLIKKNASTKYYQELEARAKAKGILRGKGGVDQDNGIFFDTEVNGKKYRYTFCFAFSSHSYDTLAVNT